MDRIKKKSNNSKKMKKLLKNVVILNVLLLSNLLISCETVSYSNYPPIILYSKEYQKEIANALERANEPILYEIMLDYDNLREKLRVE